MKIELTAERVRLLATAALKHASGGSPGITTEQAKAFLSLHGAALEEKLNDTVRKFITGKLVG